MPEYNEEDLKKLTQDAIFFILTQESKRPVFTKASVMKGIEMTNRPPTVQTQIWEDAIQQLRDTFGYEMKSIEEYGGKKGDYMLRNKFQDATNEAEQHMECTEEECEEQSLLLIVLSVIHMNGGAARQDQLYAFLARSGLYDGKGNQNDHNVKQLIEKKWEKNNYIKISKDDASDPDSPKLLYKWGPRAEVEIKKSDILKFVAHIYNKNVDEFTDEYKEIIDKEGEDCFKEPEVNNQGDANVQLGWTNHAIKPRVKDIPNLH